jgi:heparan-alpha-glucosaminide N-acetyltransferase
MATLSAPPQTLPVGGSPAARPAPARATQRLESLDVFRGLTMLLLISHGFGIYQGLKDQPSLAWFRDQFEHAAWAGCNLWDLIQPAFTFIVGVAMPLSFARRMEQGATKSALLGHVLWRALILLVLSNVLSNWNTTGPLKLQFINVLCQIAFGYVLCFLIWTLPFRSQVAAAAGLMALHHALFYLFPGPAGPFDPEGNIGAVIDRTVLGYNYTGFYTTLNSLGNGLTILFGVWTGMLLQQDLTHDRRLKILGACSAAAFALGLALEPFVPMVKRLWLGSFTFFSLGWVLLGLIACYWIVEMKGWRRWAFPSVVIGTNCIFIYSFTQVLRGWLSRGVANFTGNGFSFLGTYGAIPHNLVVLGVLFYLCYWLHQRKIYFKI